MEAALAQLDFGEDFEQTQPFRAQCDRCGADVVLVELVADGGTEEVAVVELGEVLEAGPCPLCAQVEGRGHERGHCWRCGGSRVVGEVLPAHGVAIDESGRGRRLRGRPRRGEGVHRVHVCGRV